MTYFEIGSLIFAFIALVISILAFGQQSLNSISTKIETERANNISKQANNTADRALELSIREHKSKIMPNLILNILTNQISQTPDFDDVIVISISNTAHGKAIINEIHGFGDFIVTNLFKNELVYPIKLAYNNSYRIQLTLSKNKKVQYLTDKIDIIRQYNNMLQQLCIEVTFQNEIDTQYKVYLKFDANSGMYIRDSFEIESNSYIPKK
jgi:hypothetical protein